MSKPSEPLFLTTDQMVYARVIGTIERRLEPQCRECGAGVNRPNCAMGHGGHCTRDDQEDTQSFYEVVRELETESGLRDVKFWRKRIPLETLYSFSKYEKKLLVDLYDSGGKKSTRAGDDRYMTLGSGSGGKYAVVYSYHLGKEHIELTPRGREMVESWTEEQQRD